MNRRKQCVIVILLIFCAVVIFYYGRKKYKQWQEDHSGVPDVVNSLSVSNNHHLTVVANSSKIKDKEQFARQVVHMCQDNSFHSIRFSTDINGYPSELDIMVYLNRKAVKKGEPVHKIKFSTDDFNEDYDIKNDADKFRLYLDGEEIEFYWYVKL